MIYLKNYLTLVIITLTLYSCKKDVEIIDEKDKGLKTENVIIIVIDGARYSETWGDNSHQYIQYLTNNIKPKGVVNTNFFNNGFTWTSPGHLAMVSGQYYNINNGGAELPPFPTLFQYFNETYPTKNSWIITSKDKLEVLTNTSQSNYNNLFLANTDCGVNGLGTGYREDSVTIYNAKNILINENPNLVLINFKDPDSWGHSNDWIKYTASIKKTDEYINQIFNLIETHPFYKGKTTLFITNDHGRHEDEYGGFQNHGDNCEGCRHIMFFGYGPDFKKNSTIDTRYELVDIANTTSKLLNFNLPNSNGIVMEELFEKNN
jgi:phosphopentomutase/2,3-bisphosphoglycerate-independent phosphoglycerate mutase family metalloenzyme